MSEKELIWIPELAGAGPDGPVVLSDIDFEDAEIIGPAMFVLAGGDIRLSECVLDVAENDLASAFFETQFEDQQVVGCISLRDVSFTRCEFRNIGWMGAPASMKQMRESLCGRGWDERDAVGPEG